MRLYWGISQVWCEKVSEMTQIGNGVVVVSLKDSMCGLTILLEMLHACFKNTNSFISYLA